MSAEEKWVDNPKVVRITTIVHIVVVTLFALYLAFGCKPAHALTSDEIAQLEEEHNVTIRVNEGKIGEAGEHYVILRDGKYIGDIDHPEEILLDGAQLLIQRVVFSIGLPFLLSLQGDVERIMERWGMELKGETLLLPDPQSPTTKTREFHLGLNGKTAKVGIIEINFAPTPMLFFIVLDDVGQLDLFVVREGKIIREDYSNSRNSKVMAFVSDNKRNYVALVATQYFIGADGKKFANIYYSFIDVIETKILFSHSF